MRRRVQNPFPGVSQNTDQHGRKRWRFRKKGLPTVYLPGEYGSAEFRQAYHVALGGNALQEKPSPHEHGTFDWLIEHYKRTPKWSKLAPISMKNLSNEFDRFSLLYGKKRVTTLRLEHVEAIIARKSDRPASANRLLKLIRRLCRFAIKKRLIQVDPTIGVERYKENPDGFHTWTEDEIQTFETHHGLGSKAVLALRLMLYTGAARQDVIRFGWQSVQSGRIMYRRGKTDGDVNLPILEDLAEVLQLVPTTQLLFITHTGERPYKPETFGNWFHDQCVAARLPHCSSHGLRKAGATRLANAECNELQIMAFLGHKTTDEARTYIKKANRITLSDTGMEKLSRAKREQTLSNRVEKLDIHRSNALKKKGN